MRRHPFLLLLLPLALPLAGCATVPKAAPGSELVGHSLRVEAAGAPATVLRFQPGGVVVASVNGNEGRGRWAVADGRICFDWPSRGRDCWAYPRPLRLGETASMTGSDGSVVRATLQ